VARAEHGHIGTAAQAPSPGEIAAQLIRFDTTNPPGNEAACIEFVRDLLEQQGLTSQLHARDPARPNLVVRLPGRGNARPLLVHGHVDVVTTRGQSWSHPPFAGATLDGWLWGRGAVDMKGPVASMLSAVVQLFREGLRPGGDVILALLSDEEAGSDNGSRFLVEQRADLFRDMRYSLGEGGGQSVSVGGRLVHPVMVAEKRVCWMRGTVRGPGGHGSRPVKGSAMGKAGRALAVLDTAPLPVHVCEAARLMLRGLSDALPDEMTGLRRDLSDFGVDAALERLDRGTAGMLDPLVRNTVSVTVVRGGEKVNVIPAEVVFELDGRIVPGQEVDDFLAELRNAAGPELELEVMRTEPGPERPDMAHFGALVEALRQVYPDATVVPAIMSGFTDGCQFAKLGIQNYGFLPCVLDYDWRSTVHGRDERIPIQALEDCARGLREAILRILG
jgi:acetylornithine deacetylase/succinyl-diaminopimelate desuccinylase-like protein